MLLKKLPLMQTIQCVLLLNMRKADGFDMAMTVPSEGKFRSEAMGCRIIQRQG